MAVNREGKPLKDIYVQLEDLRHPGDASSYVNVEHLEPNGAGTLNVNADIAYHLHGSTSARNGKLAVDTAARKPHSFHRNDQLHFPRSRNQELQGE